MMTNLGIIKIRYVCFSEDEVDMSHVKSHTRSNARLHIRSPDHWFCDYGVTIIFFFDVSFDK